MQKDISQGFKDLLDRLSYDVGTFVVLSQVALPRLSFRYKPEFSYLKDYLSADSLIRYCYLTCLTKHTMSAECVDTGGLRGALHTDHRIPFFSQTENLLDKLDDMAANKDVLTTCHINTIRETLVHPFRYDNLRFSSDILQTNLSTVCSIWKRDSLREYNDGFLLHISLVMDAMFYAMLNNMKQERLSAFAMPLEIMRTLATDLDLPEFTLAQNPAISLFGKEPSQRLTEPYIKEYSVLFEFMSEYEMDYQQSVSIGTSKILRRLYYLYAFNYYYRPVDVILDDGFRSQKPIPKTDVLHFSNHFPLSCSYLLYHALPDARDDFFAQMPSFLPRWQDSVTKYVAECVKRHSYQQIFEELAKNEFVRYMARMTPMTKAIMDMLGSPEQFKDEMADNQREQFKKDGARHYKARYREFYNQNHVVTENPHVKNSLIIHNSVDNQTALQSPTNKNTPSEECVEFTSEGVCSIYDLGLGELPTMPNIFVGMPFNDDNIDKKTIGCVLQYFVPDHWRSVYYQKRISEWRDYRVGPKPEPTDTILDSILQSGFTALKKRIDCITQNYSTDRNSQCGKYLLEYTYQNEIRHFFTIVDPLRTQKAVKEISTPKQIVLLDEQSLMAFVHACCRFSCKIDLKILQDDDIGMFKAWCDDKRRNSCYLYIQHRFERAVLYK